MKKAYSIIAVATLSLAVAFSASVASAAMYTRNLTIGSTGADVVSLQTTLVSAGHLVMPPGVAKGYFGPLTRAALAKWQAANGVAPAAGFFGPITMGKFNAMGASDDSSDDSSDDDSSSDDLQGGEGDFKNFDVLGNPGNETLDEGETDQVFGFEFEANDSDLRVERVKLVASTTADYTYDDQPWDYYESAALFKGTKKVAEIDNLDDEDSWDEEDDDVFSFRFTDVNSVVEEGDEAKFYVEVTAQDNLDSGDVPAIFEFGLDDNGIRVVDAEGIDHEEGDIDDTNTLTFDTADAGDLELSIDEDDNEDRTVFVDEDSDTEGVEIMRFTIEANSSDNTIDEFNVSLATTSPSFASTTIASVVKSVTLEVDGDELSSEAPSAGVGTSTAAFEDLGIEIAEDDEVEVVVLADLEPQGGTGSDWNYVEGYELRAAVLGASVDAEDAEGDDVTVTDNIYGGDIELRTEGLQITYTSSSATRTNGTIAGDADTVEFKINFKVVSQGEDIYLDGDTVATSSPTIALAATTDGVAYSTTTDSNTGTSTYTAIVTAADGYKDSDTNDSGDKRFKISKGSSGRNFTFTVSIPTGRDTGVVGVQLNGFKWDTDSTDDMDNLYTIDISDFRTDPVTGLTIH